LVATGALLGGRSYRQIFEAVRLRLADERHWTQSTFARNELGSPCKPTDPSACCWCLLGAFAKECNVHGLIPSPILSFLDAMVEALFGYVMKDGEQQRRFENVGAFNDYATHVSLIDFLGQCIARFS
jgi:hypothetical protein